MAHIAFATLIGHLSSSTLNGPGGVAQIHQPMKVEQAPHTKKGTKLHVITAIAVLSPPPPPTSWLDKIINTTSWWQQQQQLDQRMRVDNSGRTRACLPAVLFSHEHESVYMIYLIGLVRLHVYSGWIGPAHESFDVISHHQQRIGSAFCSSSSHLSSTQSIAHKIAIFALDMSRENTGTPSGGLLEVKLG